MTNIWLQSNTNQNYRKIPYYACQHSNIRKPNNSKCCLEYEGNPNTMLHCFLQYVESSNFFLMT